MKLLEHKPLHTVGGNRVHWLRRNWEGWIDGLPWVYEIKCTCSMCGPGETGPGVDYLTCDESGRIWPDRNPHNLDLPEGFQA